VLYNCTKGGKGMDKYPLIGVSLCAVVLLILASLTNVVGYQQVQSSALKIETKQLSNSQCDCDKDNVGVTTWHFPILCAFIRILINILLYSPFAWLFIGYILVLQYDAYKLGCQLDEN